LNPGTGANPSLQAEMSIYPCASTCSWLIPQPVLATAGIDALHVQGYGFPAVSAVAGAGAGTSPAISQGYSTDLSGYITLLTGTLPAASSTVFTLNFGTAYAYPGPKCGLTPANLAAQALVGAAEPQFLLANVTQAAADATVVTALAPATTYIWQYMCSN